MDFPKIPYACIFDVDDTLISNYYENGESMHGLSRLDALQIIGKRRNVRALVEISAQENHEVVHIAPYHTLESITWTLLYNNGIVDSKEPDTNNELLKEIIRLKDELYHERLMKDGKEIASAAKYLHYLASVGTKLAIASGASAQQIETDLKIIGVTDVFIPEHIRALGTYAIAKPHPEPYLSAIDSLGLSQDEVAKTWAFEDDTNGIISARKAGLRVCAITSRFTEDQLLPHLSEQDIIVQDYNDLMQRVGL